MGIRTQHERVWRQSGRERRAFLTYGVFHAPQVSPVIPSPKAGLVDRTPDIALQTETPGATIYYRDGGEYVRYQSGASIRPSDGAIEAYATADNMRDSEVAKYAYTTVSASVKDSQHVEIAFSEPVQSGSGAGITLQNGRSYRFDIPAASGGQALGVASGTQTSARTVLLTLAVDTSTMLQNAFVVRFYDEAGSYAAQSNSFLLGYVPTPPDPEPEPEVETIGLEIGEDGSVYIRWAQVAGAANYELCLTGKGCETLLQPDNDDQLEYVFADFEYLVKYTATVTAYNAAHQVIAEGSESFRVVAEPVGMTVEATADGLSIAVTWDEVSVADVYVVCLASVPDSCVEVRNGLAHTFADLPAGSYEVTVLAKDEFDQTVGQGSDGVTIADPDPAPLPPPPDDPGPSPLVSSG
ncbi:chitobiase/beta-hexosaminidase C-terminal domain-containing protein [Brevibacillus agri]|uniref:chitobiase/beta-hexosaminidase C-terminal domain-containing protein n=1 Tax=Brevibacillus agri TaxID=51101 RepID=UPI0024C0BEBF|nr:chitobiase/beta-hexosaminidase C-terminal domain-containing protein [Brevibacillus agri]MED4568960.1 chitobiase/beta-hexosaminidase C-terminal domain-containing protein [Brevibacillus agri]WHX30647.1 chitobiase/beta-hexosaminidase C-terminal domain-containing protein [Brevibacillus agri]